MGTPLVCGMRVRVRQDAEFGPGPWPSEPAGTLVIGPDGKHMSDVRSRRGLERVYWVEFDKPQHDDEGDGPYKQAQVLEKYIEPLAS